MVRNIILTINFFLLRYLYTGGRCKHRHKSRYLVGYLLMADNLLLRNDMHNMME